MKDIVDFNNFWNKKIELIDTIQPKYILNKTSFSKFDNIEFYDLTFTSYDNSIIYAKYIKNIKYRKLYRYCTQKIGQNIKLFLFSVLNFKVSKFYYF